MERLTFDGNFCDIAQCRAIPCPCNNSCTQKQVWERLKMYEDKSPYTVEIPMRLPELLKAPNHLVYIAGSLDKRVYTATLESAYLDRYCRLYIKIRWAESEDEKVNISSIRADAFCRIAFSTKEEAENELRKEADEDA